MITPEVKSSISQALALLPKNMDSPQARVMLLAIGLQESRFEYRRQIGNGPAKGYWQFEKGGGVKGCIQHPVSAPHLRKVCQERGVEFTAQAVWDAIERDDVLAAALARLLLWTDPKPLPALGDADGAYNCYVRIWRPGKPKPNTWPEFYRAAVEKVDATQRQRCP